LFQEPRNDLKEIICSSVVVLGLFTTFLQAFVFNAILEALITFICVILFGWIFAPLSKKHPKRSVARKVTKPSLITKARRENIKAKHRTIKNKDEYVNNKNFRVKAFLVVILLVIVPTILGWTQVSMIPATCPTPTFAGMPHEARLDALNFDYDALEFVNDTKDLEGISFNSMFVMKFVLSASTNKIYCFHAKLTPLEPLVLKDGWGSYSKLARRVHDFKSKLIKGPFSERELFVEVDLNEANLVVLPGKYKLEVYSTEQYMLNYAKMSNVHEYEVTIEKDRLFFDPYYDSDPLRSSRSGSIYSIKNEETLGWENHFQAKMVDSTGKSVSGMVSLYLTQRENNKPVFKKITDYNVREDGEISYMHLTRTQYREYMQGKIEYDGRQSFYYRTTIHRESCEVAQNKFIHTSTHLSGPKYTYNGTELDFYNLNDFKIFTHLKYHTEFNLNELQWTKNPSYQFYSGTPDFIYLDVSDTSSTYIESPLIQYLGTISDYASFSYRYTLYNHGTPSDDIWVDLKTQVYRDGKLVCEQVEYSGYYNSIGENWQTVTLNLTDKFTEGGQKFKFKILADFTFDPAYSDDISIRFDWADLEAFHAPVYYRGFDFLNGFNDFSSPSLGTTSPLFWDKDRPLVLGNDIISYMYYSGLAYNNLFDSDWRVDNSWNAYSGLFSTDGSNNPIFTTNNEINLPPTWKEINGNGLSIFDLQSLNPPINISQTFQASIKDEFTSVGDSDATLESVRQRYVVPKIVSNDELVIIVFAARYASEDMWKIYLTYAHRPGGDWSPPVRLYDPGEDNIYQLSPAIALSSTDLYVAWQQRNQDDHSCGETEWSIMCGRVSLEDFVLKDVKNVTTYDPLDLDDTATMIPDITLTPIGNFYNEDLELIHQDCIVHVAYEEVTWTNPIQGSRSNEDVDDIIKNLYYSQLSSSHTSPDFSTPLAINDVIASGGGGSTGTSQDVPSQPSDFNVLNGIADWLGSLQNRDNDYTTFTPSYQEPPASTLYNLSFTADLDMGDKPAQYDLDSVELMYCYKTNTSQVINLSLYNYNTQQFDVVDSSTHTSFFDGLYSITSSSYYNANFEVKAKINSESSSDFELNLDLFKLNYNWIIGASENVINYNGDLESPQINSRICYNTSILLEDSTTIFVSFNQASGERVFQINSISIEDHLSQEKVLYSSELEFVKSFGDQSILFDQDKIVLSDDLQFQDIYDSRDFNFGAHIFYNGIDNYRLSSFINDDVSLIKKVKDVYYSPSPLPPYEIERFAIRLSRNNWSLIGAYGNENLNVSFSYELPSETYFYVKYSLEDYILPNSLIIDVSIVKNEIACIFESFTNATDRQIYLDVSNENFQFQEDILVSVGLEDEAISRQADIVYNGDNLISIVYSSEANSSYSDFIFKHTQYNSSSGQFDTIESVTDPIDFGDYDYYKMLNPIINLCYNETLFIAYEVNSKKTGESNKWKIQYTYFDLDTQEIIGPFYVKSEESTEEQNPDAFWSNGVFWTFSTNNTNSWTVEFTSCARADLNSFSTLSADFMPILFNENAFSANMSVYFDLDLSFFTNDLLETEDRLRFIVTLELGGTQHVVLDTDWNSQSLDNWVENNLATYYPRYLRYFYNLSQSSLAFSEIYAIDSKVQNKVYPFELHFPYAINFSEHFNLRFNLVKDDWSLNKTAA